VRDDSQGGFILMSFSRLPVGRGHTGKRRSHGLLHAAATGAYVREEVDASARDLPDQSLCWLAQSPSWRPRHIPRARRRVARPAWPPFRVPRAWHQP